MVFGPLVTYAASPFGEMLTTLVFVAFGAALICGVRGSCCSWRFWLPGRGTRHLRRSCHSRPPRSSAHPSPIERGVIRVGSAALLGLLAGAASVIALNSWRYDTWKNVVHSDPNLQTHGFLLRANLAGRGMGRAGRWGVAVLAPGRGGRGRAPAHRGRGCADATASAQAAPALLLVGLAAQTAGLASWYAPYGWVAWGPRLMMPTVALIACLAVALCADALGVWWKVARRHIVLAIALGVGCVVSAAAVLRLPPRARSRAGAYFAPDGSCPTPAIISNDPAYYFHCLLYGSWWKWPPLEWYGLRFLRSGWGLLIAGAVLLAAIGAVMRLMIGPGPDPDLDSDPPAVLVEVP